MRGMRTADAQISEPPGRVERALRAVGAPVILAAVATKVISVGLFSGYATVWAMAAVALVPAAAATAWAAWRHGRRIATVVGGLACIACLAVAAWSWVPEPAVFGQVRAHESADTAVAEREMTALPQGACRPVAGLDLGPLASVAPWSQVCVYGPWRKAATSFVLHSDRPDLTLTYATWGPEAPGGCSARITGSWWVSVPSHVDDGVPGRCPHGFTYQPGG